MSEDTTETVETPNQVTEELKVVAVVGDEAQNLDEFIEELEDFKKKHSTSLYSNFSIAGVNKKGNGVLVVMGSRDETAEEKTEREKREVMERQRIEQAELKEYLRLKKKYGKKQAVPKVDDDE